jgi:hypothetical protein
MPTVDWSRWPYLTAAEQEELRQRYRDIIRREIEHAKATNFRAMNEAIRKAAPSPK